MANLQDLTTKMSNISMAPTLSTRAQAASEASSSNIMWDVMTNPWNPTSNPDGYVNVGVAENALMHSELLKFLNTQLNLPAQYLTYNDGGGGSTRLRTAIAQFLNRHLHPVTPLTPDQLVVTNGVSPAIEHVSWAFADPGEGVLLGRPYYGTFIPDISQRPGTTVVPVDFNGIDPLSTDAVGKYEDALLAFQKSGKKVKALMLCHPHNPLGRCYSHETLIQLMRFCQKYRIHFISDEIYALSVWQNSIDTHPPPVRFESALSINLQNLIDPRLVHVLWGMSKDFGANGIRLGVLVSQANRDLHEALKSTSLYSYSSGISDYLTSVLLETPEFTDPYIEANQKKLADAYEFTARFLKSHQIDYAAGSNAAFFVWVDLGKRYRELHPEIGPEADLGEIVMQQLLKQKVFLASGALFGSEEDGWFRIVFSQPREYLREALGRIVRALEG